MFHFNHSAYCNIYDSCSENSFFVNSCGLIFNSQFMAWPTSLKLANFRMPNRLMTMHWDRLTFALFPCAHLSCTLASFNAEEIFSVEELKSARFISSKLKISKLMQNLHPLVCVHVIINYFVSKHQNPATHSPWAGDKLTKGALKPSRIYHRKLFQISLQDCKRNLQIRNLFLNLWVFVL